MRWSIFWKKFFIKLQLHSVTYTNYKYTASPTAKNDMEIPEQFLHFITQRTYQNCGRIEHTLESSLHKAQKFEIELCLKTFDFMKIHLIYSGNAFNWTHVLEKTAENSIDHVVRRTSRPGQYFLHFQNAGRQHATRETITGVHPLTEHSV